MIEEIIMQRLPLILAASLLMAGCTATTERPAPAGSPRPNATLHGILRDAGGAERGRVSLRPHGHMLDVKVRAYGLTPGAHGMHLHAVGSCIAPGFTSAGGHWNPDNKQHGHANPMGAHRGDLPQLMVAANGKGTANFPLMAHAGDLLDSDGTALVIHAGADDERSDPAGNSGPRQLCAEIR